MKKQLSRDEELEIEIEQARSVVCNGDENLSTRQHASKRMKFLISQRSAEQVLNMEKEQGLK